MPIKKTSTKIMSNNLITKDMLLSEIITTYPSTAGLLMSWGLHCVGCFASSFDTLEGGCLVHGITGQEFKQLLKEANEVAAQDLTNPSEN